MLSKKLSDLFNYQINQELYSAYLYLHIANYYEEQHLHGFASWFNKQSKEELEHALKFRSYLQQEGVAVTLAPIDANFASFSSHLAPLTLQLEHEKKVTSLIYHLYELAREEKDYRTEHFLTYFVEEQAEEEATASELIEKFTLLSNSNSSLYLLDKELGSRQ